MTDPEKSGDLPPRFREILLLVGQMNYSWTNTESLLIHVIAGLAGTDKETAIVMNFFDENDIWTNSFVFFKSVWLKKDQLPSIEESSFVSSLKKHRLISVLLVY